MNKTLLPIRIAFVVLCAGAGWLVCYTIQQWDAYRMRATIIGLLIGALVVLVDILLKGFSLRGLSAITFGLAVGMLISFLISISPLFEYASENDPQTVYLFRLALFLACSYLGAVIALRGKDEFNLVIPYVRFVPHGVDVPLVVVDTSALIDGRVAKGRAVFVWLLHEAQPHAGSLPADASNEVRSEVLDKAIAGAQRERSDEQFEVERLGRA